MDEADGIAGQVLAGMRLVVTCSVLLAFVVTVVAAMVTIAGGVWQLLTDGRLGAALVSLLSGAGATAAGAGYRRRRRQRRAERAAPTGPQA